MTDAAEIVKRLRRMQESTAAVTIQDLETAASLIERQAAENARLREALKKAKQFIENGVELGFIRMPDDDVPDPAHGTLPAIRAALEGEKS